MSRNAIFTIYPYRKGGIWMFDDATIGVKEEAFVAGADTMIEKLTAAFGVPHPERGFVLQFSNKTFPDAQVELKREGQGGPATGTYYSMTGPRGGKFTGWLCAVLNDYYPRSPKSLFVSVKPKR